MPNLKQPQINSLIISGRLTADPEIRYLQDGKAVCNTSIATDSGWGDNKRSIFLDCTCWGKTAEIVGELKKGSPVVFEGRIHMDEWEDKKTGAKRSKIAMTVNRVHGLAWDDNEKTAPSEEESKQESKEESVPF